MHIRNIPNLQLLVHAYPPSPLLYGDRGFRPVLRLSALLMPPHLVSAIVAQFPNKFYQENPFYLFSPQAVGNTVQITAIAALNSYPVQTGYCLLPQTAVFSLKKRAYVQSASGIRSYHLTCLLKGGCHMSAVGGGFGFTSTGVILVLFILLVIVSRSLFI